MPLPSGGLLESPELITPSVIKSFPLAFQQGGNELDCLSYSCYWASVFPNTFIVGTSVQGTHHAKCNVPR